jgi:large subunit ribosomal protein L10
LPSREVLLAQFAGALKAPLSKTANLLAAPARRAAYGLKALIDSKEAA